MSNIIVTDNQYPTTPEQLAKWRPQGIRNLTPGLVERGKIKIGRKGASRTSTKGNSFQMPEKLDHFLVTTMDRTQDNNFEIDDRIMKMLANNKEIPVVLVYDDPQLNFPTRYAMYNGKTLQCTGDGQLGKWRNEDGSFVPVQCPCPKQDPTYTGKDKCKINGTLSVIIDGAEVIGGVWKFRTTSYNSVVGLLSSMAMITRITGGPLAGVPLVLKVSPKSVQDPVRGSQQTIYIVSLEYRGSVSQLRSIGYQTLLDHQKHGIRIEQIENNARALLAELPDPLEDEAEDVVTEFYPEQQEGYVEAKKADEVVQRKSFASRNSSQEAQVIEAQVIDNEPTQQQATYQRQAQRVQRDPVQRMQPAQQPVNQVQQPVQQQQAPQQQEQGQVMQQPMQQQNDDLPDLF